VDIKKTTTLPSKLVRLREVVDAILDVEDLSEELQIELDVVCCEIEDAFATE
jgi:hypothetical protein